MKNDFELIKKQFSDDITIYPISDVHLGSLEHNEKEWADFVYGLVSDPNAYVILAGDLMNNATRSSVSNIFDETLRPREQKERLVKMLKPIKDKILCAVSGNHERRSIKDVDDDPMYDVMCKLDIEDVYRQNMAFLKIQMGSAKMRKNGKGATYTLAITHGAGGGVLSGSTINRNERFAYAIDNLDCLIVGHTHKGMVSKPAKIVIDPRNDVVSIKPFTVVSTQSWLSYGGYAAQKMLLPAANATVDNGQKLVLSTYKKNIKIEW